MVGTRKEQNTMDKFLEIIYASQISDSEKGDTYLELFKPVLESLKKTLSKELYDEIFEKIIDCATECNRFYAVEGMKLAIGIMNETYIPKI